MDDNRWWGWAGLILLFLIVQAWRALFRAARGTNNTGMARLNAAAERILKERGAAGSNPIPRTQATRSPSATTKARSQSAAGKPRTQSLLPKSSTPAVIRRGSLLSGSKEPVIQRRR